MPTFKRLSLILSDAAKCEFVGQVDKKFLDARIVGNEWWHSFGEKSSLSPFLMGGKKGRVKLALPFD